MGSVVERGVGVIQVCSASTEAASRLWAGETLATASPEAVVVAIEHVSVRLRLGLGRWIRFEGYGVLLERVLEDARTEDPAEEVTAKIRTFVLVVALLTDRLSQVVGEDMAMRLVEQAWTTEPRN